MKYSLFVFFMSLTSCAVAHPPFWLDSPNGRTNPHDPRCHSYNNSKNPVTIDPIPQPTAVKTSMLTFPANHGGNYGCWDGNNFWISSFYDHTISEYNEVNGNISNFTLPPDTRPLQLAWDGEYIWIASGDPLGQLLKFNPKNSKIEVTYTYNPTQDGQGGIQGILYTKNGELWIGVAQSGGSLGDNSGIVEQIDRNNGHVLRSITGTVNVNGIEEATYFGHEYIYAACNGYVAKIDTNTMTYARINAQQEMYRIALDDYNIYGAVYANSMVTPDVIVQKLDALNGSFIASWGEGTVTTLNDVMVEGNNVWVTGNNGYVSVLNKDTGQIVTQFPNGGTSCVVKGGDGVWSVNINNNTVTLLKLD